MKSPRILGIWMASCSVFLAANLSEAAGSGSTPLQIEQTIEANYPPSALQEGVTSGQVWMIISVDETGALTDALVTRYTHPGFASEASSMLRTCKFYPARKNGVPVPVRSDLHLSFESTGQIMTLDAGATLHQLTAFGVRPDYIDRICAPTELDQLPSPTQSVAPQHPGKSADGSIKGGRAMLDFIIDEHGVFTASDLIRIWHEPDYIDMHDELLQLMKRFALCYPVAGSAYVAPQLLPPTQPDYEWRDTRDLRPPSAS